MKKMDMAQRFTYAGIVFASNLVLMCVAFFMIMGRPWQMDAFGNYAFMSLVVSLGVFWACSVGNVGVFLFQGAGFILSQCFVYSQAFQKSSYQQTLIYAIIIYGVCLVASIFYYQYRVSSAKLKAKSKE